MFRVYRKGEHPKPKKHFFKEEFLTIKKARNFCKNRIHLYEELTIVHTSVGEEKI